METIDMHKLLVNGIIGAGAPKQAEMEDEYVARKLAVFGADQRAFRWDRAALDALPNHVLVGIYERVAA